MSYTPKFEPALCLVVLTNGPKEKPVYLPICDYLFGQGFTPIEVRSPGEALIHTRQAKFSLILIPDDDIELIKKIKSPDGLNCNTIIIAISSVDVLTASTKELLDLKVIQQVVIKSQDLETFQRNLLDAIKCQLLNYGVERKVAEVVSTMQHENNPPQESGSAIVQQNTKEQFGTINSQSDRFFSFSSQSDQPYVISSQSHQPHVIASQSQPSSGTSQLQQPYFSTNQSGEFLASLPLQPFTLVPPLVIPYTNLLPGNSSYNILQPEGYMMPRIVDFSPKQNQVFPHMAGHPLTIPSFSTCSGQNLETKLDTVSEQQEPDSTNVPDSTYDVPTSESTSVIMVPDEKEDSKSCTTLPGFQKFLECLCPESKEDKKDEEKTSDIQKQSEERPSKRTKIGARQMYITENTAEMSNSSTTTVNEEDLADKNPLSVLQACPYFMNLDEKIEGMAFDPKAKPSDRHNAKERHRRIRITKAAEFFKDILPCMNPGMDKASAFHVTVYYIIFLRNALRQIDPAIVDQLHKSYSEEWQAYFDTTAKNDKQID